MGAVPTETLAGRLDRVYLTADPDLHRTYSWKPATDYGFASRISFVPVLLEEIFPVAGSLPIVFAPKAVGDLALAVVAPEARNGMRAVLPGGRWIAGYVPSILRLHPFACSLEDGRGVLFDPESPLIDPAGAGMRFFDVSGVATPAFERVSKALSQYRDSLGRTQRAVSLLRRADLLQPARSLACFDDPAFDAVLVVNSRALAHLIAVRVPPLFSSGALALAHAHLTSVEQAQRLAKLSGMIRERASRCGASAQGGSDSTFFDLLASALAAEIPGTEDAK